MLSIWVWYSLQWMCRRVCRLIFSCHRIHKKIFHFSNFVIYDFEFFLSYESIYGKSQTHNHHWYYFRLVSTRVHGNAIIAIMYWIELNRNVIFLYVRASVANIYVLHRETFLIHKSLEKKLNKRIHITTNRDSRMKQIIWCVVSSSIHVYILPSFLVFLFYFTFFLFVCVHGTK